MSLGPVPNQFPTVDPGNVRLACVGESPGRSEVELGRPFCGPSGQVLDKLLGHAGISRSTVFVGNVCQVRPSETSNEFDLLDWQGTDVQAGIAQLVADLAVFKPNIVMCLGNAALHLFMVGNKPPPRGKKKYNWPNKIGDWRGSLFQRLLEFRDPGPNWIVKCIASYHPAAILRDWSLQAYCKSDFKRCVEESRTSGLVLPQREIVVLTDIVDVSLALAAYKTRREPVSFDLEGGINGVTCFSIARDREVAHVIPLCQNDGTPIWNEETEWAIWQMTQALLEDDQVPKILQNALYDQFVLAWSYGIVIRGLQDDTMAGFWELNCELEKGLAVQASFLTREPFYKSERLSEDDTTAWTYCGKDSAVTFECNERLQEQLARQPGSLSHYRFNISLLPACLYMELRGLLYDKEQAKQEEEQCWREVYALQHKVNVSASRAPDSTSTLGLAVTAFAKASPKEKVEVEEVKLVPYRWNGKKWVRQKDGSDRSPRVDSLPLVISGPCWLRVLKKKLVSQPLTLDTWEKLDQHCKESCRASLKRALAIVAQLEDFGDGKQLMKVEEALTGELATLLGLSVNIASTSAGGDAQWYLYEHCQLPKVFKKEGNRLTTKLTTDDDALLSIYAKTKDERVMWCLQLRKLLKESTYLRTGTDQDGRVRMGLNIVGTKTGRMACYSSPTGASCVQLQTISKKHRHLYLADPGCLLAQADLRGADSWTVACWCAALGDTTMLDDLKAGMKIQSILVLLYNAKDDDERLRINRLSRDELRTLCKTVDEDRWDYHACKSVAYGSFYGAMPKKISETLAIVSYKKDGKPIYVSSADCGSIQAHAFFVRYPGVRFWHTHWANKLIAGESSLTTSFGHKHVYHGRKVDYKMGRKIANQDTLRELLATEPQLVTGYCTKQAIHRCWYDPENRQEDGSLRVEMLLSVHDSIVFQLKQEDKEWARTKIKQWFDSPVTIAGVTVTIPFSGTIGKDWGMKNAEPL